MPPVAAGWGVLVGARSKLAHEGRRSGELRGSTARRVPGMPRAPTQGGRVEDHARGRMQELPLRVRTTRRSRSQRASLRLGVWRAFEGKRGASSTSPRALAVVSPAPDSPVCCRARRSDSVVGRKPKRFHVIDTSVLAAGIYLNRGSSSRIARPFSRERAVLLSPRVLCHPSNPYASPTMGGGGSAGSSGGAGGGSLTGTPGYGVPGGSGGCGGDFSGPAGGGVGGSTWARSGPVTPSTGARGSRYAAPAPSPGPPSTASDPCRSRAPARARPWRHPERSTCFPGRA